MDVITKILKNKIKGSLLDAFQSGFNGLEFNFEKETESILKFIELNKKE